MSEIEREALKAVHEALRRVQAERDLYRAELQEAHTWMLAQGWCDCEYFEGIGTKPCRFAEALASAASGDPVARETTPPSPASEQARKKT